MRRLPDIDEGGRVGKNTGHCARQDGPEMKRPGVRWTICILFVAICNDVVFAALWLVWISGIARSVQSPAALRQTGTLGTIAYASACSGVNPTSQYASSPPAWPVDAISLLFHTSLIPARP
jgi:hypothetical protein